MSFNTNTENNETWLTPPSLLKALGTFDLDPCAALGQPWATANKHYTIEDDGLAQDWKGRVWLNPPYGKKAGIWMAKLAKHTGGGIALVFARTDTKWFHANGFAKAYGGLFLEGRVRFYRIDGTRGEAPNGASILLAYSKYDYDILLTCGLAGKCVRLCTSYEHV